MLVDLSKGRSVGDMASTADGLLPWLAETLPSCLPRRLLMIVRVDAGFVQGTTMFPPPRPCVSLDKCRDDSVCSSKLSCTRGCLFASKKKRHQTRTLGLHDGPRSWTKASESSFGMQNASSSSPPPSIDYPRNESQWFQAAHKLVSRGRTPAKAYIYLCTYISTGKTHLLFSFIAVLSLSLPLLGDSRTRSWPAHEEASD